MVKIEEFINEFWPQWPLRSLEAKVNKYFIRSFEVILESNMVTRWHCYHFLASEASEVIRAQTLVSAFS